MKTLVNNQIVTKRFILITILSLVGNVLSAQNKLSVLVSEINFEWAIPIVCVFVFATFMFYAFLKQRNH